MNYNNDASVATLPISKDFTGSAILKLNPKNRAKDTLALNFEDTLVITFGRFVLNDKNMGVSIDPSKNYIMAGDYKLALSGGTGAFAAQYFGSKINGRYEPSEAVGTFRYDDAKTLLTGAFGVLRK